MNIDISKTIGEIRTAIDDIRGTVDDDFSTDTDEELKQALMHSVESLLMELPPTLIEPQAITNVTTNPEWSRHEGSNGDGYIVLPKDFLRFLDIKIKTWLSSVYELIESGSDEEKMQRSKWSRATVEKPKAMLDTDKAGQRIVRYWPGNDEAELELLTYVPAASKNNGVITCALREETKKNIIYRAASIFLEGKKEDKLADRFRQLSMI